MDITEYARHTLAAEGHHEPSTDATLAVRGRYLLRVATRVKKLDLCQETYARWIIDGVQTDHPVICSRKRGHEGAHGSAVVELSPAGEVRMANA